MSPPATPPKKPATQPAKAPPAPAASPPAPAELAPIQSWSYPFATTNDKAGAEPFFAALAQADSGFYPLGANGLWHGGVHFDSGTGSSLKQSDGIRAIADGEVVAYLLNDTYPALDYPGVDGGQPRRALYSSGFVLMHHRLALPPDPSIKPPPANPPADEVLDFYSLVMHQASWTQYLADGKLKRPRYWKSKRAFRIGKKDQQTASSTDENASRALGANVREAPIAGKKKGHYTSGKLIGFLPENSEVIIGTQMGHWGQLTSIVSGAVIASEAGGSTPEENTTDAMGWVYLPEQNSVIEPDPVDSVVVLDPPVALKAGEVLGQLGEYQRYRDSTPLKPATNRPLLHVECFAGSTFPAFLAKSKARAAQLPITQKNLLVVPKGTSLISRPAAADASVAAGLALKPTGKDDGKSLWIKVQPQTVGHSGTGKKSKETLTPSGSPVWVARASLAGRAGCEAWSAFPLQGGTDAGSTTVDRIFAKAVLEKRGLAVDDSGVAWHEIDALADGGSITGWVSESKARWESPFAWPGFEVVDASSVSVKDAYERQLVQSNSLLPGEKDKFQPSADVVNNSALMATLDNAMDRSGDKMLDTQELKQAMAVPSLAQGLSRIIGRYESEWGGDMARWQAMTPLMKTGEPIWQKELERIEKLQWWSRVGAVKNFPGDPKVYHFHPIGLIENFNRPSNLDELIKRIGDIIASGEGGYEAYNSGTKDVPNGGVGHSYMHPKAGTVTGKTINEIIATDSLSGTDSNRMFATGKYQTVITTLKSAKTSMGLTGDEKYDAEMQERVFREYLLDKAGGGSLGAFVKEGKGTVDDAQYAASKEWASIAAPNGKTIKDGRTSDGTLSYYESAANAASQTSSKNLRAILQEIEQTR